MTHKEALKLALEALEDNQHLVADNERHAYVMEYNDLIEKCKEALAQPEQEPDYWLGYGLQAHTEKPFEGATPVWTKSPHPKEPEQRACNNSECGWSGTTDRMLGSIGPLCPNCGETTEAAQPEQEPVAMKFKIYKPTVPDPVRQDINNALLPWVYDQDRSSGFDASMWVTPVATLTPQRKPLTDEQILTVVRDHYNPYQRPEISFARAIEAAHGIKE